MGVVDFEEYQLQFGGYVVVGFGEMGVVCQGDDCVVEGYVCVVDLLLVFVWELFFGFGECVVYLLYCGVLWFGLVQCCVFDDLLGVVDVDYVGDGW